MKKNTIRVMACLILVWLIAIVAVGRNSNTIQGKEEVTETAPEVIVETEENSGGVFVEEIPKIVLDLQGVSWEEVNSGSKDTKYKGNKVTLEWKDVITSYENVQLKGRGNSTWDWPKKPYQIKFAEKIDLFGMGEAKTWILLANYRDVSLLRNEIAFRLARELSSPYAIRGTFAELYVGEQYIGLYYVTQKVEIGKNTVNLMDPLGILVEVEAAREADDTHVFSSLTKTCLVIKESVSDDDHDARNKSLEYFANAFDRLEQAAYNGDWETVQKEIDVESFVHYFLISEFTANPDAYVSSFYLYRNGNDDVIHAGPVWDFDMAFANVKYIYGDATSPKRSWAYADPRDLLEIHPTMSVPLFQYLMDLPEFRLAVENCYQKELSPILHNLPQTIQKSAETIEEKALADQDEWHMHSKFWTEVDKLKGWCTSRMEYMDILYGKRLVLDDGTYLFFVNKKEYCLDIKRLQNGNYQIVDKSTGMVLSLADTKSIAEGQKVCFATNDGSDGQQWIFVGGQFNETFVLSKSTGLALEFYEGLENMSVVEYNGNEFQKIVIKEVCDGL